MARNHIKRDDISIVLCGAAGQGIQTVEQLMTHVFHLSGYNLFSTKEYMSRVRGGSNSTELRVSSIPVRAYTERIDILFPLNVEALHHCSTRITEDTIILGDREKLQNGNDYDIIDIPFGKMASELGGAIYANIIAIGLLSALFKVDIEIVNDFLEERFGSKGEKIVKGNKDAASKGYEIGKELSSSGQIDIELKKDERVRDQIVLNGGEAVGIGALAGGCNFISAYPMTPSTSVLTFLSEHAKEFGVIAEQAEDEIAAMNMTIGAWYAGARGLVSTAGGGFALMVEALSLSGMLETPVVVHVGQRPAPATGLPTRTEQGDLLFTLFSGHGEFARAIYAPGTLRQTVELTKRAFDTADKYQSPVFVLTDQYLVDSYYNLDTINIKEMQFQNHIVQTTADYKRYAKTEHGISPRGIPGYGEGVVVVDSDEHDYEGHITEDHCIREEMVNRRYTRKLELLTEDALAPEYIGSESPETIVVCWGSTYYIVREAIQKLDRPEIAMLHFSQVYPLHPKTNSYLKRAKKHICVENNIRGQFAMMLKLYADFDIKNRILKYNGLPFSVEELALKIEQAIH